MKLTDYVRFGAIYHTCMALISIAYIPINIVLIVMDRVSVWVGLVLVIMLFLLSIVFLFLGSMYTLTELEKQYKDGHNLSKPSLWHFMIYFFIPPVTLIAVPAFFITLVVYPIKKQQEKKAGKIEQMQMQINSLEKRFNYLNTKGFEDEANKIKSKLKSLNKIEEIEKDINALEIKINIRDNILNIINEVISQSKR